ncbi:acyl-CoA thioester hydrolase/BAAT C-terminal domain-containing protein [Hymenobacter sp. M29]|uniref:Acyl-CoA thioester hydrolase/BAAT C-terminal domain-containing protein n=1 Tax=Hymenobacter mellowenesis TaxID=3063995 RepID=A0ABT9A7W0_9BACT|nr:CocE/NonD family hydrolase [Hymenobacter sp. M29]MDO7844852.1 acyl-CoA thioester hydrolase/BAAT C-terminal domain-containing protein [Hymenobacter sp. M29]
MGFSAGILDRAEAVAVTSPAGGVRLNGILRLPTGQGPFPAAVLLPERGVNASNPNSPDNQLLNTLADYLVSQGVVVLRLHERGQGGSGGSAATTTLAERSADAIAALNYLRTRPQVDVTRLGLIGHGEGANVALLAGAQPLAPTFVVAMAAAGLPGREVLATQPAMYGKVLGNDSTDAQRARKYRLDMVAAEQEAAKMRLKGSNAAQVQTYLDQQRLRQKAAMRRDEEGLIKQQRAMLEIVRQTPDNSQAQAILGNMLRQRYPGIAPTDLQTSVQTLTTPAYRSYLSFDPQPELPAVKCPVLLLQGEADQQVNANANLASLKKGLRSNARVVELRYPNLNHALQFASDSPADAASAAFNPDTPADIYKWISTQN